MPQTQVRLGETEPAIDVLEIQTIAEAGVGKILLRVKLPDKPFEFRDGVVVLAEFQQGQAQVIMSAGAGLVQGDRFSECGERLVQSSAFAQHNTQMEMSGYHL